MAHSEPDTSQPFSHFLMITREIKDYLQFLANTGCNGFDCSKKTLHMINNWSDPSSMFRKSLQKRVPNPETEGAYSVMPKSETDLHPRKTESESLEKIREDIGDCKQCKLCEKRRHIVFGTGNPKARLVFVGEAPGYEEDRSGEPFVGEAGQLLTKIIQAIHLTRDAVYICNVIKCRPPMNRNPESDEISACLPFLKRQLEVIEPEFICTLGTFAAHTLLETTTPVSKLRGRFHDYKGMKLLPTFHPAYLLRYPEKKREVWTDMKLLMKEMEL